MKVHVCVSVTHTCMSYCKVTSSKNRQTWQKCSGSQNLLFTLICLQRHWHAHKHLRGQRCSEAESAGRGSFGATENPAAELFSSSALSPDLCLICRRPLLKGLSCVAKEKPCEIAMVKVTSEASTALSSAAAYASSSLRGGARWKVPMSNTCLSSLASVNVVVPATGSDRLTRRPPLGREGKNRPLLSLLMLPTLRTVTVIAGPSFAPYFVFSPSPLFSVRLGALSPAERDLSR